MDREKRDTETSTKTVLHLRRRGRELRPDRDTGRDKSPYTVVTDSRSRVGSRIRERKKKSL